MMGKARKSAKKPTANKVLPELGAFFICERVLVEQDLVSSAIRIVDIVDVPAPLRWKGARQSDFRSC